MAKKPPKAQKPPFETLELITSLRSFFKIPFKDPLAGIDRFIGSFRWGVYIFYDYDGEPIYVGQTNERISQRISRHLTNQRTDAVAMSVLDPFEVFEIEVFPMPKYQDVDRYHANFLQAKRDLNGLEFAVHQKAIEISKFGAILNEKDPVRPAKIVKLPQSFRGRVVSDEVMKFRVHPDVRTARRAQIISRLAQTISERQVQVGLRRTLMVQAARLHWIASQQFSKLGGEKAVEEKPENDEEKSEP